MEVKLKNRAAYGWLAASATAAATTHIVPPVLLGARTRKRLMRALPGVGGVSLDLLCRNDSARFGEASLVPSSAVWR